MAGILEFVPDRFRSALATLLTAFDYAADIRTDPWQLAIELSHLESNGATLSDIRWLILRKFAEHAKETTVPGDAKRSFRALTPTYIPEDTCFVLSPDGAATIRSALGLTSVDSGCDASGGRASLAAEAPRTPVAKPEWDATRRELRFRGQVIKRYRVPARNQALVLAAFQEMGWPEFIDDPLPPSGEQDPKHRLHATIKSLNRNQLHPLIRFHGNGNGMQVSWEAAQPK
jgi:hypothetical protein